MVVHRLLKMLRLMHAYLFDIQDLSAIYFVTERYRYKCWGKNRNGTDICATLYKNESIIASAHFPSCSLKSFEEKYE